MIDIGMKLISYFEHRFSASGVYHHLKSCPRAISSSLLRLNLPSTLSGWMASEETLNHLLINGLNRPSHITGPLLQDLESLAMPALR